jgi:NAD(P)-dependent dehydrogenase (short-subunit alcohol dehydrogenase family)
MRIFTAWLPGRSARSTQAPGSVGAAHAASGNVPSGPVSDPSGPTAPAGGGLDLAGLWNLSGRVAIVTGASSGFGARFARVLAAAGASVVAAARRLERLEALASDVPGVVAVRCDVASDDDCRALVDTALDRFDRIDVLVNNAGASDAPARVESQDPAQFRAVMEVNLNAAFVLSSLVAPSMIERGSGSIVNIGSVHGQVGSAPNTQAAYVASKHGLVGLTRELALQWARRGIRVNCIAPGYFETELTAEMFSGDERGLGWITRNTPMNRAGQEGELDGVLLFLAGDGSRFCTGQVLAVEGGWTAR